MSLLSASAVGVNRFLIEGVARAGMGEPFIVENEAAGTGSRSQIQRVYRESCADGYSRPGAWALILTMFEPVNFPGHVRPAADHSYLANIAGLSAAHFNLRAAAAAAILLRLSMSQMHSRTKRTELFAISGRGHRSLSFPTLATASLATMSSNRSPNSA